MIKKLTLLILLSILINLLVLQSNSFALTAKEIIDKSEKVIRGNSQISLITITIKTRRWTRTLKLKNWENRLRKKSFSEIIAPKKDAGNRFLLINKNMRHYIPKIQRVIKISPSMMLQSWMGSDFTNDDIIKESSILEDYNHSLDGKKTVNGHNCYKIIMKPKPNAPVVWGKIIYYARVEDALPVREEMYNEHGVLKKVMTFSNFKKMHDRVIPTKYKMETIKKKNRYTLMEIIRIKFNVKIPGGIFTLQNLKRR